MNQARPPRTTGGSLIATRTLGTRLATGGISGLLGLGGLVAQVGHAANPTTVMSLYGASLLMALITAVVKLYDIRCKRSPAYVTAASLARNARRHPDPDRAMRLTLTDRALARGEQLTGEQLAELLADPIPPSNPGCHFE